MEKFNLKVSNLSLKYYGGYLGVDMVSFEANSSFAILGKAMSGKTSLLRCIANVESYQGEITTSAKDIAFTFDLNSLKKNKSVKENIAIPLKLRKIEHIDEIVLKQAKLFHIESILDKQVKDISLSEKRLTILARALIRPADLYLLDDPLKDVEDREKYFEILFELIKDKNVIYSTTKLEEARRFNSMLLMAYKKAVGFGAMEDILKEPKTIDVLKLLTDYTYENIEIKKEKDYYIEYLDKKHVVPKPISDIYVNKEVVFAKAENVILDMYFDKSTEYLVSTR